MTYFLRTFFVAPDLSRFRLRLLYTLQSQLRCRLGDQKRTFCFGPQSQNPRSVLPRRQLPPISRKETFPKTQEKRDIFYLFEKKIIYRCCFPVTMRPVQVETFRGLSLVELKQTKVKVLKSFLTKLKKKTCFKEASNFFKLFFLKKK